jgi:uncharacterized protein (TIGR02246 family)
MTRLLSLVLVALPACAHTLGVSDRQQIQTLTRAEVTALLAQNWQAFATQYAEDAIVYPPHGSAILGKAAITEWIKAFPPIQAMTSTIVQFDGHGDLAYVAGSYTMTTQEVGQPAVHEVGKYVEIRRRQSDGRWLIIVDIFNSDLPAVPPSK